MNFNKKMSVTNIFTILMALCALILTGCNSRSEIGEPRQNIEAAEEVFSIGVNAYLWRATLDTLNFMPIATADHQSGSILTDWKVNPNDATERSKVDAFIVGRELQANSLRVTVHRESLQNGNWVSIEPRPEAAAQVVTAILAQARLLRRDNAPLTN